MEFEINGECSSKTQRHNVKMWRKIQMAGAEQGCTQNYTLIFTKYRIISCTPFYLVLLIKRKRFSSLTYAKERLTLDSL